MSLVFAQGFNKRKKESNPYVIYIGQGTDRQHNKFSYLV